MKLKIKIFTISILGLLCEIISVFSLPMFFGLLVVKIIWFDNLSIWFAVASISAFVICVPLRWFFNAKVQKLNLEIGRK